MKKFLIFLAIFLLGSCAFAVDYSVYKFDNGQTVIIKQVKNNPIVIIDTWVKTGSINENEKNNGVSHFLEHLFFKGTKKYSPGEFDKILESKGAITNAATSKDFTHYYIKIPSKYFDLAIDLHADMLLSPMVPRKELEKERKVVMEEIAKDADNPSEKVYDNLIEMLYKKHPYKMKVLGTEEVIGKISRKEILNYYKTHYGPGNMVTIIIGDVEPEHALDKVKETFNTSPRKLEKNVNKKEKELVSQVRKIDYQKEIQGGYLLIGFRGSDAFNNDTYALDVLATILGDGRSSILYEKIKEQKQLAFSISAGNLTYREDGIFVIKANFIPENLTRLEKSIFKEINKIKKDSVTFEQLQLAQKIIERDTYYSRESISNIASEIGYTTALTDNPKYYNEYLDKIGKVNIGDIKRVANKYLNEDKCAVSVVLPEKSEILEIEKTKAPEYSAKLVKEIPSTKKYILNNGSTLLISPNDLNDIVAMSIYIKGGEFLEKIPGTANIMSSVMMKGTKNYSSLELAQILEENGIKISPSCSADTFSIDVLTTKPQLEKTFVLLNEIVNDACFNDYEIEKTKNVKLNSIKKSRDLPINYALEEYKSLIFENSVYSYGSKIFEKTIPKVCRKNILEYYGKIFNPKNIVISVNGDVDKDYLVDRFSEIFGMESKGTEFNYDNYASKIYPVKAPKTVIKDANNLQTAWLITGWQTTGVKNEKDYATLEVIDNILGSGMNSRLFINLRKQKGLAYQLGSSYSPKILKGAFTLYIGTNPKTLDLAQKMLMAEVNKLKTEFVSNQELQQAKEKIIGNYILSQETNLDKASTVGSFEVSGQGFDFKDDYEKLINSVTASDIIEVANKYFNENSVTSIVK